MAARLTHLEVLKQSLHHLEHEEGPPHALAFQLKEHSLFEFAALGSIAPDLYYFYHLLNSRKNRQALYWGNLAHHSSVFEVPLAFLDDIRKESEGLQRDKKLAFALGYLTHCATDIVTHPYIFYKSGDYYSSDPKTAAEAQANHLRVEYALDSWLIHHKWNLSPRKYNYLQYIEDTYEYNESGKKMLDRDIWRMWVRALRKVFPQEFEKFYIGRVERIVRGDILNESWRGFLRFNAFTDVRFGAIRFALRAMDTLTLHKLKSGLLVHPQPHKVGARISNTERKPWKYPADPSRESEASFLELVNEAARFGAEMLMDAIEYTNGSLKRSVLEKKYLGYNLDTGLRSDSLKMQSFQVERE